MKAYLTRSHSVGSWAPLHPAGSGLRLNYSASEATAGNWPRSTSASLSAP